MYEKYLTISLSFSLTLQYDFFCLFILSLTTLSKQHCWLFITLQNLLSIVLLPPTYFIFTSLQELKEVVQIIFPLDCSDHITLTFLFFLRMPIANASNSSSNAFCTASIIHHTLFLSLSHFCTFLIELTCIVCFITQ